MQLALLQSTMLLSMAQRGFPQHMLSLTHLINQCGFRHYLAISTQAITSEVYPARTTKLGDIYAGICQ